MKLLILAASILFTESKSFKIPDYLQCNYDKDNRLVSMGKIKLLSKYRQSKTRNVALQTCQLVLNSCFEYTAKVPNGFNVTQYYLQQKTVLANLRNEIVPSLGPLLVKCALRCSWNIEDRYCSKESPKTSNLDKLFYFQKQQSLTATFSTGFQLIQTQIDKCNSLIQ